MSHRIRAAASLTGAIVLAGCTASGLSPREVPGRTQSAMLYSMYDHVDPAHANTPPPPLRLPANVAIVQVGEVAPPQVMIDKLRKEPDLFRRVEVLPGAESYAAHDEYRAAAAGEPRRPSSAGLRRLAADMGMNYVLLVGGTIDRGTTGTPLSILDLTIIGAAIVPSQETRAVARASAALIDVPSGRVLVSSSAEASGTALSPSFAVEGDEMKLLEKVRDEVVTKLGAQVIDDTKHRAITGDTTGVSNNAL